MREGKYTRHDIPGAGSDSKPDCVWFTIIGIQLTVSDNNDLLWLKLCDNVEISEGIYNNVDIITLDWLTENGFEDLFAPNPEA